MKHRIAGFLGELAEELGWTPELEHARVKPETTERTPIRSPSVLTPDDDSPALRATPVERMQAEINQLQSTVKHLGSEVINLRAQMAKLRSVPVPPDAMPVRADDSGAYARTESGPHDLDRPSETDAGQHESAAHLSAMPAVEPAERQWPPRLVPVPAPVVTAPHNALFGQSEDTEDIEETESTSPTDVPASEPATVEVGGLAAQPEPTGCVEIAPAPSVQETPDGPVTETPAQRLEPEPYPAASAPTIIEIGDSPEAGLELFPSEPDPTDAVSAGAGGKGSTEDAIRRRKRRKRRGRDWSSARF